MPNRATLISSQAQVNEEKGHELNEIDPGSPNLPMSAQAQAIALKSFSHQRTQIDRFITGPALGLPRGRRRASISPLTNTSPCVQDNGRRSVSSSLTPSQLDLRQSNQIQVNRRVWFEGFRTISRRGKDDMSNRQDQVRFESETHGSG